MIARFQHNLTLRDLLEAEVLPLLHCLINLTFDFFSPLLSFTFAFLYLREFLLNFFFSLFPFLLPLFFMQSTFPFPAFFLPFVPYHFDSLSLSLSFSRFLVHFLAKGASAAGPIRIISISRPRTVSHTTRWVDECEKRDRDRRRKRRRRRRR